MYIYIICISKFSIKYHCQNGKDSGARKRFSFPVHNRTDNCNKECSNHHHFLSTLRFKGSSYSNKKWCAMFICYISIMLYFWYLLFGD